MSTSNLQNVCPALLLGLGDVLNGTAPVNNVSPLGIQALLDPENTRQNMIVEQLDNGSGHIKQVRVARQQRALKTDITDGKDCDAGTERPWLEEIYTINYSKQHVIKVKESTVRTLCDAYSQYLNVPVASRTTDGRALLSIGMMRSIVEVLMLDLDVMRQAINDDFIDAVATGIGTWVGGATDKSFNVINADGQMDWRGIGSLKQELKKTGMKGIPIIVGGGNIDTYYEAKNFGCCNAGGYDFAMNDPKAPSKLYFDDNIGTALGGANNFLLFMPGSIKFLTFNEYVGEFSREHDGVVRGTFPDPELPGVRYDIRLVPNRCDEDYDLFVNLSYDFYLSPEDLYATDDRLEGVNGIFEGIATNS